MKHTLLILGLILSGIFAGTFSGCSSAFAQGDLDEQSRIMLRDESSWGVFLNSNGYGGNYRYGFWRDYRNQFLLDFHLDYVKHPKEFKSSVSYNYNTYRYVFGKENIFVELRSMAGWQRELYRKIDRGGISVRWFGSGGLSLGFLKPIYYKVFTTTSSYEIIGIEHMKFHPSIDQQFFAGRAPFHKGLNEIKLVPGITGRTGFSFEYSGKDAIIHALEASLTLTVYPQRIPIMYLEDNDTPSSFFFVNLNVGYRFGRVKDVSNVARNRSRKEKRAARKEAGPAFSMPGI